tara:strand:- start:2573 stop:2698 length:126 start_codon:yes stop_codon:yes gene_type:complete
MVELTRAASFATELDSEDGLAPKDDEVRMVEEMNVDNMLEG